MWISTHWSRTQKVCPRTFEYGAPSAEGPAWVPPGEGTGKNPCRNPQASLAEEKKAPLVFKVAISKLNVFLSNDTGKEPLKLLNKVIELPELEPGRNTRT